ncbi:HNH endonuclease [Bradyrhizobium sp. USDA 4452]
MFTQAALFLLVGMPVRPPTFRPNGQRSRQQTNAEYDARRGSARDRGYDAAFDRASALFKQQHPLCLGCEAIDRVSATDVTDHVVPHKGDRTVFWDRDRWQPACRWHHDVVKQRLEAMYASGAITAADLWLNSAVAMRLTRQLDP